MSKFQFWYISGVLIILMITITGVKIQTDNKVIDLNAQIQELKLTVDAVTTKDERIKALESELEDKRKKIDEIYEDVDEVYIKWFAAQQESVEFRQKFINCKVNDK